MRTALTLEVPDASPSAMLTMAVSGACHHSARETRPPLPVDTLDNGYISSVGGIGTTPGGRLKDPADTSSYGVSGANGVIAIRTKGRVG